MKNVYLLFITLVLLLLSFTSCMKDKFDVNEMGSNKWNPDIAAPVINTSLSMKDLMNEAEGVDWQENNDNSLYFIFAEELFSQNAQDIITIPDQVTDTTVNWNLPVGIPPGDSASQTVVFTTQFNSNSDIIDSISLDQATVNYTIETNMNHDSKMEITVPGLTKNGNSFKATINLKYTGSLPQVVSKSYNISDYSLEFSHSSSQNYLTANVKITGYGDSNPNTSPYYYDIESSFSNIEYKSVFGYLSQYDIDMDSDSVELDFFKNDDYGNISIKDPTVRLRFYNSFGMPIEGVFNTIKSFKPGDEVELTQPSGAPLANVLIGNPGLTQMGDVVITDYVLNSNNSNIEDVFNINPHYLIYDVTGVGNPGGNTYNFIMDTSSLKVEAEVELPFFGSVENLVLRDTVDFNLGEDAEDFGELQSADMQILIDNGFPIEADIQVYFADSNSVVLDSLFEDGNIISGSPPGSPPSYKSTESVSKRSYITKEKGSIDNIVDARKAIIKATLSTTNSGSSSVKIYSDYNIGLKLGVRTKFETDF
ncbi:MAG: hypothetical protein K9I29_03065 [Bacteroidales bacterium]|nr:hypothetical protein [Bacteroidales bacterium]